MHNAARDEFWDNKKIEAAIAEYNKTGNERLYAEVLYPPFVQLAAIIYSKLPDSRFIGELDDAVQEAILHLNRYLPTFDSAKSKALTWAHLLIKSCYIQIFQAKSRPKRNATNPTKTTNEFPRLLFAPVEDSTYDLEQRRKQFLDYWTPERIRNAFKYKHAAKARRCAAEIVRRVKADTLRYGYGPDIAKKCKVATNTPTFAFRRIAALTKRYFESLE